MFDKIKKNYEYKELLWEFSKKDIKLKYRNSGMGIIWTMLNPLLVMIVLTFVFSNLFKNSIPNFPVYCLSGRLIFNFFSQSTNQCMNSIVEKNSLIKKIYIPKYLYPLSRVISSFLIFLISLIPLICIMFITHVNWTKLILLSLYPLICLFFICLGFGLILSTINVFFRDMQHLYSVILLIMMYGSAIFYSPDIINPKYVVLLNLSPMFPVINIFRDCILYGKITNIESWILASIYAILAFIIGIIVFCKNEDKFILYI